MKNRSMMLPMLAGFFVMGFGDIIGTVMNQVKAKSRKGLRRSSATPPKTRGRRTSAPAGRRKSSRWRIPTRWRVPVMTHPDDGVTQPNAPNSQGYALRASPWATLGAPSRRIIIFPGQHRFEARHSNLRTGRKRLQSQNHFLTLLRRKGKLINNGFGRQMVIFHELR